MEEFRNTRYPDAASLWADRIETEYRIGYAGVRRAKTFSRALIALLNARESGAFLVSRLLEILEPEIRENLKKIGSYRIWSTFSDARSIGEDLPLSEILDGIHRNNLREILEFRLNARRQARY